MFLIIFHIEGERVAWKEVRWTLECTKSELLVFIPLSVQFSHSIISNSLLPHWLQHAKLPCPSPTLKTCSISCTSSQWYRPTISSSVITYSSCLQSFSTSGSFQISQFFISGGQRIGVSASASVLPMNIQDWSPLGWTGWIILQSKGLSRVFSKTTVQRHQFFGIQLSLKSNSYITCDYRKNNSFDYVELCCQSNVSAF